MWTHTLIHTSDNMKIIMKQLQNKDWPPQEPERREEVLAGSQGEQVLIFREDLQDCDSFLLCKACC